MQFIYYLSCLLFNWCTYICCYKKGVNKIIKTHSSHVLNIYQNLLYDIIKYFYNVLIKQPLEAL